MSLMIFTIILIIRFHNVSRNKKIILIWFIKNDNTFIINYRFWIKKVLFNISYFQSYAVEYVSLNTILNKTSISLKKFVFVFIKFHVFLSSKISNSTIVNKNLYLTTISLDLITALNRHKYVIYFA